MIRRTLQLGALLVVSCFASTTLSKVDPMRVVRDQIITPEAVIILDTSGSMNWRVADENTSGPDCGGNRAGTFDLTGDGVCSGGETTTDDVNENDCSLFDNSRICTGTGGSCSYVNWSGQAVACNPSYRQVSRLYMVKRVLRSILPSLKDSANFGFVTFNQTGQYFYYKYKDVNPVTYEKPTSFYLSQAEMKLRGAWDSTNAVPKTSFVWQNTTYTLSSSFPTTGTYLDAAAMAKDSLYTDVNDPSNETRYAFSAIGLKGEADGKTWVFRGSYFTYNQKPPIVSTINYYQCNLDGCVTATGQPCCNLNGAPTCAYCPGGIANLNSCRTCPAGTWDYAANSRCRDCADTSLRTIYNTSGGKTCGRCKAVSELPWNKQAYIHPQYTPGSGAVENYAYCQYCDVKKLPTDPLCKYPDGGSAVKSAWVSGSWTDLWVDSRITCGYTNPSVSATYAKLSPAYLGPQPVLTSGANAGTWVFFRYNYSTSPSGNISANGTSSQLWVSLTPTVDESVDPDLRIAPIMALLNDSRFGGLRASGSTPTGTAVQVAHQHFIHKRLGACSNTSVMSLPASSYPGATCPFTTSDEAAGVCRTRFVLLITDGDFNTGVSPVDAAATLYNDSATLGGKRIKTLVVGMPGLPTTPSAGETLSPPQKLAMIADAGADGSVDNPACCCVGYTCTNNCTSAEDLAKCKLAYLPSNEAELLEMVKAAINEGMQGDYTTSQVAVTTTDNSTSVGDTILVPSVKYPGWKGQLRSYKLNNDNTVTPNWDAGIKLRDTVWSNRQLFTESCTASACVPVSLLETSTGAPTNDFKALVNTALGDSDGSKAALIAEWLAGKQERRPPSWTECTQGTPSSCSTWGTWKLGPIFRSTPAIVGPPPKYETSPGHADYEAKFEVRTRLVYIMSNDGLLHAFNADTGEEAFAYVPSNLLAQIYALAQRQGQDDNPLDFEWILASSPRVEDIPYPRSGTSPCDAGYATSDGTCYRTQLVVTMGPGAESFAVLDVTDPSQSPPFQVVNHSSAVGSSTNTTGPVTMDAALAKTWSIPTLYWTKSGTDLVCDAGMGSGYDGGSTSEGKHHLHFSNVKANRWGTFEYLEEPSGGFTPAEDYGVMANPVAVIDTESSDRLIVDTYQADMAGRIVRFPSGDFNDQTFSVTDTNNLILGVDLNRPFYSAPAAFYRTESIGGTNTGVTYLAAISGSYYEMNPTLAAKTSKLFMIKRAAGGTPDIVMNCDVGEFNKGGAGCSSWGCKCPATSDLPASCTDENGATVACSSLVLTGAKPLSSPYVIENKRTTDTVIDTFYLVFRPSTTNPCNKGVSFLLRTRIYDDSGTLKMKVVSINAYQGLTSGLTVVGGGFNVVIAQSGFGANSATVIPALSNNMPLVRVGGQVVYDGFMETR